MDKSTAVRLGIAGAVAGAGLAAGGVAVASAASDSPSTSSSDARPHGPRGDQMAKVLADELGVKESKVQAALDAVRESLAPRPDATDGERPTPPTEAERTQMEARVAAALADELGVSEAKVKAALEVVRKQMEADHAKMEAQSRSDLVTRLDAAVKAGTLTKADKTSVLKAFDADVLGGPMGGAPGGPGGPGRGHGAPPAPEGSSTD